MRRKNPEPRHALGLSGVWLGRLIDRAGRTLWWDQAINDVTAAGLTDLLDVAFAAGTQKTQWFAGLIDGSTTITLASSDTLASHAGWSEVSSYSGSRKQWSPTVAGGLGVNSAAMSFAFTSAATLGGLFLCSVSSGTSGILWSTAAFAANRAVSSGQTLQLYYRLRAAAGGTRP